MNHCHHFVVQTGNEVPKGLESGEYKPGFSSSANTWDVTARTGERKMNTLKRPTSLE